MKEAHKILYIDHYPGIAGGQKSLLVLLSKLDRESFQPIVACDNYQGKFYKELTDRDLGIYQVKMNHEGIMERSEGNIYKSPLQLFGNLPLVVKATWRLMKLVRRLGIDLIHANSFKAGVFGSLISNITGVPLIFRARSSRYYSYHGWIDNFICSSADAILANSEFVARSFNRWEDKIFTIFNPIDLAKFNPTVAKEHKIRDEFCVSDSSKLVGLVGRITPRKRQEDLIRAIPEIIEEVGDIKFLLIGEEREQQDAKYPRRIKKMIDNLEISEKVIFTGYRDDIVDVMSALDALVLPSLEEPLARVLIEALALKVPIVASRSGGTPEIIKDGETGLLFPPKDSEQLAENVLQLLSKKKLAQHLTDHGEKLVKRSFSNQATVEKEERIYISLIKDDKKA